MSFMKTILSFILAVDNNTAGEIASSIYPKVQAIAKFIGRLLLFVTFIYCLYSETAAAILIAILVYFIIELEIRVDNLEKELEIEKKINREAYSIERYAPKAQYSGYLPDAQI